MFHTVKRCFTPAEAMQVRMFLESRGIEVYIPDEITSMLAPMEFVHGPGIRVQVLEESAEAALAEMKDYDSH